MDLDLEKFFDRVNHDRLLGHVARRVADTRLLTLIRAFLNAGVMENGLVGPRMDEGVPQGGPLSPVLSNLVLDELDRELERRGHRFVRYADDCNVYVGSGAEYDRALVRRGDVTLWLTPDAIATWAAAGVGRRSGQLQYSDLAIETALTLSLLFHVPLRQTEGFLTSIFGMLGVDLTAPDHTTLSRRGQHLALALRRARPGTSLHLIVDSTGLSIVGDGEWAAGDTWGPRATRREEAPSRRGRVPCDRGLRAD